MYGISIKGHDLLLQFPQYARVMFNRNSVNVHIFHSMEFSWNRHLQCLSWLLHSWVQSGSCVLTKTPYIIRNVMTFQTIDCSTFCSTTCSGQYQRRHQSSTLLCLLSWIYLSSMDSFTKDFRTYNAESISSQSWWVFPLSLWYYRQLV